MHAPDVDRLSLARPRAGYHRGSGPARRPELSAFERRIVERVVEGDSDSEIAGRLGVPYTTVKSGLQRVRNKFGLLNRVQIAVLYVKGQLR